MRRLVPVFAFVALLAGGPAHAAQRMLWPGVTVETGVQFTPHGPVAINILRGPRPGGTTTLEPVLSNETLTGLETLTAMQRRLATTATSAGVNGDYYTFATGRPSGVLMREGQLLSPPRSARSSAGISTDGTLDVRRIAFFGTWQGNGQQRPLVGLNEPPPADGAAVYTQAYGTATPAIPGATAVILFPFPAAVPNVDLQATVVEVRPQAGSVAIPFGGAVLLATGASSAALAAEAVVGETVTTRLLLKPDWTGIVSAVGGGPQIVRSGAPVFRAGEGFTASQLSPRAPRTGVGQLADGGVILVTVDGRQPGYSVGLTNFELGQTLVRLGAVTGMAFDGGGSTTMAFDGTVLNRPSEGRERAIATALMFMYTGVFAPEPPARVSPNGDGVDETPKLSYRLVRSATISFRLVGPDGTVALSSTAEREPGTYQVPFPPQAPVAAARTRTADTAPAASLGRWSLEVSATDDLGQASSISRSFVVDDTLGFLVVRRRLGVPPEGRELPIGWKLARDATTSVVVLDQAEHTVRSLVRRRYSAGSQAISWNGLGRDGGRVPRGAYTVRVRATGTLGRSELSAPVVVRHLRAQPPK